MTIQRVGIGLTVLGLSVVLAASAAEAGPAGQCVRTARQARRQCVQGCNATFQSDFVSCFGPGGQCAETCIAADTSCKSGPLQRFNTCANDPSNAQSCRSQLKAVLTACVTDIDPSACADRARLAALECRQACLDGQTPALDDCRDALRMCLVTCGGASTTTTTAPSTTTTTAP